MGHDDGPKKVLEKADYKVARAGIVPWDMQDLIGFGESGMGVRNNAGFGESRGSLVKKIFVGPRIVSKVQWNRRIAYN